jgi:hypothetical protein
MLVETTLTNLIRQQVARRLVKRLEGLGYRVDLDSPLPAAPAV